MGTAVDARVGAAVDARVSAAVDIDEDVEAAPAPRCGFVAILGAPNAGKSTLLNQLVGTKLAAVTPKVQTTRTRLLGIAIAGVSQLVFIDTPGIFTPRKRLERAMVRAAWDGAASADLALLLADVSTRSGVAMAAAIAARLKAAGCRSWLALNKIDCVERERLLGDAAHLNAAMDFGETFMISARSGDGCADLLASLSRAMPEGPPLFPLDQVTTAPERLIAAELTREQAFLQLHDELPYALMVETEAWENFDNGAVKISQVITTGRERHKGMLLGKGGQRIRAIRTAAQAEIARLIAAPVHLFLHVRVDESWAESQAHYDAWGLDYKV